MSSSYGKLSHVPSGLTTNTATSITLTMILIGLILASLILLYLFRMQLFGVSNELTEEQAKTQGFGYYKSIVETSCHSFSGKCIDMGIQTKIKLCIPNSITGRGCINSKGLQTFAIIAKKTPCLSGCRSQIWEGTDVSTCTTDADCKPCVPDGQKGTRSVTMKCVRNDNAGVNACIYKCGDDEILDKAIIKTTSRATIGLSSGGTIPHYVSCTNRTTNADGKISGHVLSDDGTMNNTILINKAVGDNATTSMEIARKSAVILALSEGKTQNEANNIGNVAALSVLDPSNGVVATYSNYDAGQIVFLNQNQEMTIRQTCFDYSNSICLSWGVRKPMDNGKLSKATYPCNTGKTPTTSNNCIVKIGGDYKSATNLTPEEKLHALLQVGYSSKQMSCVRDVLSYLEGTAIDADLSSDADNYGINPRCLPPKDCVDPIDGDKVMAAIGEFPVTVCRTPVQIKTGISWSDMSPGCVTPCMFFTSDVTKDAVSVTDYSNKYDNHDMTPTTHNTQLFGKLFQINVPNYGLTTMTYPVPANVNSLLLPTAILPDNGLYRNFADTFANPVGDLKKQPLHLYKYNTYISQLNDNIKAICKSENYKQTMQMTDALFLIKSIPRRNGVIIQELDGTRNTYFECVIICIIGGNYVGYLSRDSDSTSVPNIYWNQANLTPFPSQNGIRIVDTSYYIKDSETGQSLQNSLFNFLVCGTYGMNSNSGAEMYKITLRSPTNINTLVKMQYTTDDGSYAFGGTPITLYSYVDDGSDQDIHAYLSRRSTRCSDVQVINNEDGRQYHIKTQCNLYDIFGKQSRPAFYERRICPDISVNFMTEN